MRKFLILLVFVTALPSASHAGEKVGRWLGWYPSNVGWNEYTRYNPHLENGTHPHPEIWRKDPWQASDWISQRQNGQVLLQGFYQADIIRDHGVDKESNVPIITVGPNFYRLGGKEKNRVIASVSAVNNYAGPQSNNVVILRDWYSHADIGAFTAQGLMLQ